MTTGFHRLRSIWLLLLGIVWATTASLVAAQWQSPPTGGVIIGYDAEEFASQPYDAPPLHGLGDNKIEMADQSACLGLSSECNAARGTVRHNNLVGNQWDDYVAATKLRRLDDAGLLSRQERLLTPDIFGKSYVKPDYTIWNSRGTVSAFGEAKAVRDGVVPFDAQSRAFVEWATVTESKKLIYYVPWKTQAHTNLLNYAAPRGVNIQFVIVP